MEAQLDPERVARRALALLPREDARLQERGSDIREGTARVSWSDDKRLARLLRRTSSTLVEGVGVAPEPPDDDEMGHLSKSLVTEATAALRSLREGTPSHQLTPQATLALEAVISASTRPSARMDGEDLQDLGDVPGAEIWRTVVDTHRNNILAACQATGAVRVLDRGVGGMRWVQGTAWLISSTLAITNRHLLFPPQGGVRLARRVPGTQTARLRRDVEVTLDFAWQNAASAGILYRITEIVFVADDKDPVDAAILRVEPLGIAAAFLTVAAAAPETATRIYVVGHPGIMQAIPEPVRVVFGNPDEKKRVSFGEIMKNHDANPADIIHDASTIGGFSGGCVLPFLVRKVIGLHYWGDSVEGNRAISAGALRGHSALAAYI